MSGHETEEELRAMLLEDERPARKPKDVRLEAKPAPAREIKDLKRSMALNEWLVLEHDGRRYRKGRLVVLTGGV